MENSGGISNNSRLSWLEFLKYVSTDSNALEASP